MSHKWFFLGFFDNGIEPDLPIGLWNIDDYGHCDIGITHWQPIVLPKKKSYEKIL